METKKQAMLYYLYMLIDGEVSKNEKLLFVSICKELNVDSDEQIQIINECKNLSVNEMFEQIYDIVGVRDNKYAVRSIFSSFENHSGHAKILWNLINLGYADGNYTKEEEKIVSYVQKQWEIDDDLYQEMIDVAETCLACEKHKAWAVLLEDSWAEKLEQINKDISFAQQNIMTTLSEVDKGIQVDYNVRALVKR